MVALSWFWCPKAAIAEDLIPRYDMLSRFQSAGNSFFYSTYNNGSEPPLYVYFFFPVLWASAATLLVLLYRDVVSDPGFREVMVGGEYTSQEDYTYQGQAIRKDELVEGEDNKMWTFSLKAFDEKTGATVDYATEQSKQRL